MNAKASLIIMISGRGSNMAALIEACKSGEIKANVVKVISDNAEAAGLLTAQQAGIETASYVRRDYSSKQAHEEAIIAEINKSPSDLICLAGFMRILSAEFVAEFENKILNIHPSLLPKYPGLNTHVRALEAGDKEHGCSVHIVTQQLDEGPVVAQAKTQIDEDDDEISLAAKVLKLEHPLYIKAVIKSLPTS